MTLSQFVVLAGCALVAIVAGLMDASNAVQELSAARYKKVHTSRMKALRQIGVKA